MRRYQWLIGAILLLLAGVFGFSLAASGATHAQVVDTGGKTQPATGKITSSGPAGGVHAALPAPARPNVVLYDQYNNAGLNASLSQEFEPANATFSSQVGDDFVVPAGQTWNITEVDAQGAYFNGAGPATSFNVFFYSNSGTLPGTPVYTATAQTYTGGPTDFVVNLATPAVLAGGQTYWVSVQAVMSFTQGGEWGWQDRSVTSNSPSAWRNPGGGFGVCPSWGVKTVCIPGSGPDAVYRLVGTVGAQGTATATATGTPPTATPTAVATATACAVSYTTSQATATIIPGTVDIGNHCDDCVTGVTFPFPVTFYGVNYTAANASSNGNLQFGGTSTSLGAACLPNPSFTAPTLFLYQDDLNTLTPANCPGGCGIWSATLGTAPNRTFILEWRTYYFGRTGNSNEELIFNENSPVISMVYGPNADNGAQETSGVQRSATGPFTQFSCLNATLTNTLKVNYTPSACGTPTATPTGGVPTATATRTTTAVATPTCGAGGAPGPWTNAAPYPRTIVRYAFAQANGNFYVLGGVSDGSRVTDVNMYNPATNTWTARAPIPFASEAPTAAYYNGKIYLAEGDTGNQLGIYDIASNTWTAGAPTLHADNYGAASGAGNGKFYVVGGGTAGPSTTVQVYDIATNTWSMGTAAPSPFFMAGYTQVGQYLYIVGGYGSAPSNSGVPGSVMSKSRPQAPDANSAATMRLDLNSGTMTTGPAWTMARADFALASDGANLYAIGGDTTGGGYFDSSSEVDQLSLGAWPAGTWAVSPPALPAPLQAQQAGFYGAGAIWSVGGLDSSFTFHNTNQYRTTGAVPCQGTPTVTPTAGAATVTRTATRTATPGAGGTPVCPPPAPVVGSITTSDPTQTNRLFRGGVASACGAPNTPGAPIGGTYHYDAYTYTNNSSSQICVTATLDTACSGTNFIYAGAYLGSFDPNNITANLIGDLGTSPNPSGSFGFNVPAGANFIIVVSEVTANAGCSAYTLTVTTNATCTAVTPSATTVPPTLTATTVPPTLTATTVPPTLTRTAVPPTLTATRTAPAATGTAPAATATAPAATNTPVATETPCTITFTDVQPSDYFYEPVRYLYCHGVISGYADNTFRPYNNTTRSQMVKIVVLGFNKPIATPTAGGYTFADVPPSNPFFSYIETAASLNIVSGYTCGTVPGEPCDDQNRPYFRPYANVTRGQLSKIDVVAAGWTVINPATQSFADVFPNTAFYTFVETAYCHGIISGYNCGGPGEPCDPQSRPYFRQFNDATRGQIAKIVYLSITNPPGSCATP
jgi:hypothetical protein